MTVIPCGTDAGYRRHLRKNESACRDCLQAHAVQVRRDRNMLSAIHGSGRGLRQHLLYGSPVCDRCMYWQDRLERDAARYYLIRFTSRTAGLPLKAAS